MARRDHRNRVAGLLACAALVCCARAGAEEPLATQLFHRAVESLRGSDYAAAADAFRQSYALSARPAALCNLALTY
ncbi:MAG: hypothetical protein JWN44_1236, partial [Myxococcales bacterium]|nr:hypothetical protein [Myxococcales bacterium]